MTTLRLQINDDALDRVLKLLSDFSKEDVKIIAEDSDFIKQKEFVTEELLRMDSGQVEFITISEMNSQVKDLIAKYEG